MDDAFCETIVKILNYEAGCLRYHNEGNIVYENEPPFEAYPKLEIPSRSRFGGPIEVLNRIRCGIILCDTYLLDEAATELAKILARFGTDHMRGAYHASHPKDNIEIIANANYVLHAGTTLSLTNKRAPKHHWGVVGDNPSARVISVCRHARIMHTAMFEWTMMTVGDYTEKQSFSEIQDVSNNLAVITHAYEPRGEVPRFTFQPRVHTPDSWLSAMPRLPLDFAARASEIELDYVIVADFVNRELRASKVSESWKVEGRLPAEYDEDPLVKMECPRCVICNVPLGGRCVNLGNELLCGPCWEIEKDERARTKLIHVEQSAMCMLVGIEDSDDNMMKLASILELNLLGGVDEGSIAVGAEMPACVLCGPYSEQRPGLPHLVVKRVVLWQP